MYPYPSICLSSVYLSLFDLSASLVVVVVCACWCECLCIFHRQRDFLNVKKRPDTHREKYNRLTSCFLIEVRERERGRKKGKKKERDVP